MSSVPFGLGLSCPVLVIHGVGLELLLIMALSVKLNIRSNSNNSPWCRLCNRHVLLTVYISSPHTPPWAGDLQPQSW